MASAKYFLIVVIEAAIDMSNHIISRNRLRVPEDYADTFRVMKETGFFDEAFAEKANQDGKVQKQTRSFVLGCG